MLSCTELMPARIDKKQYFYDALRHFASLGLFDASRPLPELLQTIDELSFSDDNPCLLLGALFHFSGGMLPLIARKELSSELTTLLHQMATGKCITAHCLTEKGAGTDSLSMKTSAVFQDSKWYITGQKSYICSGPIADFGLVYAKSNTFSSPTYDLLAILVDLNNTGVVTSSLYAKLGLAGILMSDITFNNVESENAYVLGHAGLGYAILQMSTTYERMLIPLSFLGRMRKLYTICQMQCKQQRAMRFYLQDMDLKIRAAQAFVTQQLQDVVLTEWSRAYISIGCRIKIFLTDTYLEVLALARNFNVYFCEKERDFVLEEKKAALAAWVYSGTNDSLRFILEKFGDE